MSTESGEYLRSERLLARVGRLAYRAAQRAMTLDVTRLMRLDASDAQFVPVDPRFTFRFLTADEVHAHSLDPANDLSTSFVDRLLCGRDLCFAVLDGDILASYAWLALESIEADQNRGRQHGSGVAVSFGAETAFTYKAFTRPEFRGRHLYAASKGRVLGALSARGVSRLLVTTDWTNRAALAGLRRAGFRDIGLIWRFGWHAAMFTIAPRGIRALGVRLGGQADVHERTLIARDLVVAQRGPREPAFLDT